MLKDTTIWIFINLCFFNKLRQLISYLICQLQILNLYKFKTYDAVALNALVDVDVHVFWLGIEFN